MINTVLTRAVTSITELKKNPLAVVEAANGETVAVLNHNKPRFYCVPAEAYEALMERLAELESVSSKAAKDGA